MESVEVYIANNNPSMKYLRLHYRKLGIFIDSRDRRLLDNLKLAFELRDKSKKDILALMSKPILSVGSYVFCEDEEFQIGRVTQFFASDDSLMQVLFNERKLPTMCDRSKLTTVNDEIKRKFKVIY